jgi:Thymidylate synthase complementing protein
MYSTKILLDSISPAGRRLTTWELTYPRMVHAELMTHRLFSRNSASSRAIPNERLRRAVAEDPALPMWWGKNQSGMQAREELVDIGQPAGNVPLPYIEAFPLTAAKEEWLRARDLMLKASESLANIGLHKQLCNRLIEPWMFITVIVSATSFDNWFHLRDHWQAQPEIAWVAKDMHEKWKTSTPTRLAVGEWHLPLIDLQDRKTAVDSVEMLKKVSTGRVARVSLLTHDGKRDLVEDVLLHDRLLAGRATGDPLHMSPFEHIAKALVDPNEPSGNFRGWGQYRKEIVGEHYGEVLP